MKNMGILLIVIGIMATVLGCKKEKEVTLFEGEPVHFENNQLHKHSLDECLKEYMNRHPKNNIDMWPN